MLTSLTIHQFHETRRMEIMKLFKKALLATAIFGAVGVNAATVSSKPIKLSAEGVAAGIVASDVNLPIDFVLNKTTPAASVITLTFDDKVALDRLQKLAKGEDNEVAIINDISGGVGYVDFNKHGSGLLSSVVTFNYGTGSFTFDRFSVNADAGTVSFEVNLGNAITADSAFRLTFSEGADANKDDDGAKIDVSGAAVVKYSSVDSLGNAIETGSGVVATTASQFELAVTKEFDGRIERAVQKSFSQNYDGTSGTALADSLEDKVSFYFVNNEGLAASLAVTGVDFKFTGNFDNGIAKSVTDGTLETGDFKASNGIVALDEASFDYVTIAATPTEIKVRDGGKNPLTLTFDGDNTGPAVKIPQTGNIKLSATVKASNTSVPNSAISVASSVDAGQWALDAVVVNIPYFPVGFEGLDTSVHFANESANDAEVLVTAIDQAGKPYNGVLADLAGNTVTKYSQTKIMDALKAPAGSKLSVTFNIDANEGDVQAYAFSNAGTGRQALVTSQQNGK